MALSLTERLMRCLHVLLESFHPLHFVAGMGIGMTAGIMYNFPIASIKRGFRYIGIIYFFINLVVVALTHLLFALKYLVFPYVFPHDKRYAVTLLDLMHKPKLAVFAGASQMSFVTLVNMLHYMKPGWSTATFVLWWLLFAQTLLCAFVVMFFIISHATNPISTSRFERRRQLQDLERTATGGTTAEKEVLPKPSVVSRLYEVSPTLLLPLVTCTVTSASGGLITSSLQHPHLILAMVIVTTMLLSVALCSSFLVLGVVFTRLFAYGLPRNNASFTMFVPIGLMGQGSLAAMLISKELVRALRKGGFSLVGMPDVDGAVASPAHQLAENLILLVGVFVALCLTAFGVLLTVWATFSVGYWYVGFPRVGRVLQVDEKLNRIVGSGAGSGAKCSYYVLWTPTMWAATFPLGTIAFATRELHEITAVGGFVVVSTVYSFAVILVTTWCMVCTGLYIVPWRRLREALQRPV